jgi:hypothetical protein
MSIPCSRLLATAASQSVIELVEGFMQIVGATYRRRGRILTSSPREYLPEEVLPVNNKCVNLTLAGAVNRNSHSENDCYSSTSTALLRKLSTLGHHEASRANPGKIKDVLLTESK